MNTLKLYSPLFPKLYERNEYGDLEEYPSDLSGRDATEHFDSIGLLVRRENDDLPQRGLMEYFHGETAVDKKVYSAVPGVEIIGDTLYGVMTCQISEDLTDTELVNLTDYISGQYSDGWGEGAEQRPIKVADGELYISFWESGNKFYIKTEDEFFGRKQSVNKTQTSAIAQKSKYITENLQETLRGLTNTAIEKACVLGEEAKDDIASLRETVCELVRFWDLDERYIDQFDMDVADVMPQESQQMGGIS